MRTASTKHWSLLCAAALIVSTWTHAGEPPPAPGDSIEALWADFDPHRDPLEVDVFRSEDEDGGRIRIDWLYFTGQTWEGEKTRVFAYRGAPVGGDKLPAVLHIHGGGQTAHIDWPRYWARRGYVCASFDFCGDTNLPNLGPGYRREHFTRWGKIQANMMQIGGGRQMQPSPRHNPWHNWVRMARRAITLLEAHPQADPSRIGIFGISVGGSMTWMVAGSDARVKAAVPIYGNGWESYHYPLDGPQVPPDEETRLWRTLVAPETYAPRITCPTLFLSATNDGHGKMDLGERTLALTGSGVRRQLFTAGYDHHIGPAEARSLDLWMDLHLKGEGGPWPHAPRLEARDGEVPAVAVVPDRAAEVEDVHLYYCLNNRVPMSRFWQRVADLKRDGDYWTGRTPFLKSGDVILAFATVAYTGGRRVSSGILEIQAASLPSARPTLEPELLISAMDDERDWYFVPAYTDPTRGLGFFEPWAGGDGGGGESGFTFNPRLLGAEKVHFHIGTHKIGATPWRGSGKRSLAIDLLSAALPADLQVRVVEDNRQPTFREFTATPRLLRSSGEWTTLVLAPEQLTDAQGNRLEGWEKVDFLALVGSAPASPAAAFKRLRWIVPEPGEGFSHLTPVPPADLARIEAAAPSKAQVSPRRPRKLLVYGYAESFHPSVPYGARALEAMGRKSGAFETFFTTDTSAFEPASLSRFDAVFLLNITPAGKLPKELFLPDCGVDFEKLPAAVQGPARERNERLKRSLMDFVRGGKGLCGNHSTADCFYGWREFGTMLGGYFDGHPWHEKVTLEVVDPKSPVSAAFGGTSFEVVDEIYQFKETYTRDALHILARLDTSKVDVKRPSVNRKDDDFAVSWIREWGKGRVFYSALGHREETYHNTAVMAHFLDGIQFALGDLEADARPTGAAGGAGEAPAKAGR